MSLNTVYKSDDEIFLKVPIIMSDEKKKNKKKKKIQNRKSLRQIHDEYLLNLEKK